MKFLRDVCAESVSLREALLNLGHDVLSAREHCPHASDEALLTLALEEKRVLITEDKDFGELVFLRGLPHPGIARLGGMTPTERADAIRTVIERYGAAMLHGAIMVVTGNRIQIRSALNTERLNDS